MDDKHVESGCSPRQFYQTGACGVPKYSEWLLQSVAETESDIYVKLTAMSVCAPLCVCS